MPIYLSGAQYAQRLLNDPDQYVPELLDQVVGVIGPIFQNGQGLHIMASINIDGLPLWDQSELADVVIELNDRPETVQDLIARFDAGQLTHVVVPQEAAILVRTAPRRYGAAYISLHQRLGCVRVQIG